MKNRMSDIEIKKQIRHLVSLTLKGGPGSGGAREGAGRPRGSGTSSFNDIDSVKKEKILKDWDDTALLITGKKIEGGAYGLSKNEVLAIKMYTYERSPNYNLRKGSELTDENNLMGRLINDSFDRLPDNKDVVYRGLNFNSKKSYDDFKDSVSEGKTFQDKGFMSSSIDKSILDSYSKSGNKYGVQLTINGGGKDISSISVHDESEVLFKNGSKFRISKISEDDNSVGNYDSRVLKIELDGIENKSIDYKLSKIIMNKLNESDKLEVSIRNTK